MGIGEIIPDLPLLDAPLEGLPDLDALPFNPDGFVSYVNPDFVIGNIEQTPPTVLVQKSPFGLQCRANREAEITASEFIYWVWPLFSGKGEVSEDIWQEFLYTDDPAAIVRRELPTFDAFQERITLVRLNKLALARGINARIAMWADNTRRMASVIYPDNPSRTRR